MRLVCLIGTVVLLASNAALADMQKIETFEQFVEFVQGKKLTRPLIRLEVSADGRISGRGATWDVEGNWSWQNGYFCRDLFWGGDALGYNCQEVRVNGNRIRFTSDRGAGDTAVFRLN
ncbi:MAG: dihydrodipicolinate reductase [Paracoccaceae bacterium]